MLPAPRQGSRGIDASTRTIVIVDIVVIKPRRRHCLIRAAAEQAIDESIRIKEPSVAAMVLAASNPSPARPADGTPQRPRRTPSLSSVNASNPNSARPGEEEGQHHIAPRHDARGRRRGRTHVSTAAAANAYTRIARTAIKRNRISGGTAQRCAPRAHWHIARAPNGALGNACADGAGLNAPWHCSPHAGPGYPRPWSEWRQVVPV